jgi:hypothetical protein
MTIEDLAVLINKGFENAKGETNKQFDEVKTEMSAGHKVLAGEIKEIKNDVVELRRGQEEMNLKLAGVAYRYEVKQLEDQFENRFRVLERKVGIKNILGSDEISYDAI